MLDVLKVVGMVVAINGTSTLLLSNGFRLYYKRKKRMGITVNSPDSDITVPMAILFGPFMLAIMTIVLIVVLAIENVSFKKVFKRLQAYSSASDYEDVGPSYSSLRYEVRELKEENKRLQKQLADYMLIAGHTDNEA